MSHILDVRRLLCPLPVLKLQKKAAELKSGETILIMATDPGVLEDIPTWCRMYGHTVLKTEKLGLELHIAVKLD